MGAQLESKARKSSAELAQKTDQSRQNQNTKRQNSGFLNAFMNQNESSKNPTENPESSEFVSQSSHKSLKLAAKDSEDLEVISALCQDAIIPAPNFVYRKETKQFQVKINRFCHESEPFRMNQKLIYQRVLATLEFNFVDRVQTQNFDQKDDTAYYNLMAIQLQTTDNDTYLIDLMFSEGAKIRLSVSELSVFLIDSRELTYTPHLPSHDAKAVEDYEICKAILREKSVNENRAAE